MLKRAVHIALIVLIIGLGAHENVAAQDQENDAVIERIEAAFAEGETRAIIEHSSDRVEISIFGNSSLYSRNQSRYVLEEFFREYVPEGCQFEDVAITGDSRFATGYLHVQQQERPLRLFVRMRAKEGTWLLREIRIDRRD